jgi:hypothetical protein
LNFATPKFNKAVADLKALCGTHTQLFRYGQFYVTRRTMDDLLGQITADLSANLRFAGTPDQLKNTIAFFSAKLKNMAAMDVDVVAIMNMLNLIELNGDMAAIRAMFDPTKLDEAHAQSDFNDVWSNTNISAAPLFSGSPASLGKARAAFQLEKGQCFNVLKSFAAKLLKKRGGASLPPTVILSETAVAGARPKQTAPGTPASLGVAEILARETLDYAQPPLLSAAAKRMRAALDAGGFIHCGVLSGALHDHSRFPNPEHHILVFAYDTIDGQDAFLFWDPDAAHSNIAVTGWADGFGVLFSRDGRLCTGVDDADLADIDRTKNSPTEGDHLRDTRRHSYQVYSLLTLPVRARIKLHVKVLSPPVRTSVDEMLGRAVEFFAANGLEMVELSRETIDTPGTDLDRFQILFVGTDPKEATADVRDLHTTLRQPRDFGVTPAATELIVAFVDSMVPAHRGSAVHPLQQPGIIVSAAHATEWTLAHEIGRVIGLVTSIAPGDLTYRSTEAIVEEPPLLSEDNLNAMLESSLVEV